MAYWNLQGGRRPFVYSYYELFGLNERNSSGGPFVLITINLIRSESEGSLSGRVKPDRWVILWQIMYSAISLECSRNTLRTWNSLQSPKRPFGCILALRLCNTPGWLCWFSSIAMGTVTLWVGEWTLLLFLIISIRSILFNYLSPGASLLHFSLHPISGRTELGWRIESRETTQRSHSRGHTLRGGH